MKHLSRVAVFVVVSALAAPSLLQAQNNPKSTQGLYPDSWIVATPHQGFQNKPFSDKDCRYATHSESTAVDTIYVSVEGCSKESGNEALERARVFAGTEKFASYLLLEATAQRKGDRVTRCRVYLASSLPNTQSEADKLKQKLKNSNSPMQAFLDTISSYDPLTGNDEASCREVRQKLERRAMLFDSVMRAP